LDTLPFKYPKVLRNCAFLLTERRPVNILELIEKLHVQSTRGGFKMVSQTVVFKCDEALQMKAVAVLIQRASSFRSSIYLSRSGRRANAKSLLGVMSLGIENAAEIEITAEGEDQQAALDSLVSYLENPGVL